MTNTINDLNKILDEADCLVDEVKLNEALDKMASQISADLADKMPLVLCVMNGGLIPTAALIERLHFPLELDYIHATRYGMETEGASLNWLSYPQTSLKNRHILVIDDIFDQGHTLQAIVNWLEQQGTSSVYTATVINKLHDRKTNMTPDYIGTEVADRFLFGYGMDYKGFFRNLKGIYAIKGS
ncbi:MULTISPECIES: hypoxanthine-guanine phosphoribosyltransferase [Marinomonas]|uniref:Hypoxanthine-guanine phosphoribosyltransferase n=1 Tax=Marinomonas arctica TaxID=383750 RepID=A0A7H1J2B1_9GAMM|nr:MULTISPECIES: hypoxanthine-guanine phosphoribosyltransferase [Marinomonas]MCS7487853.1 hypoxanthine-guanine phosphoribosyltransferase [Marinomonas sp. BSi20414]QNT04627.1 hypoxanthine-guanine phosphoribosyltransferase [Marinomonas arctica]GGN32680.1 hypoxanthine-guanine phosphoribosyltransferase [Marinomonas arctica]